MKRWDAPRSHFSDPVIYDPPSVGYALWLRDAVLAYLALICAVRSIVSFFRVRLSSAGQLVTPTVFKDGSVLIRP